MKRTDSPITTSVASCRLNTDQMRRLDAKAKEKGLERSILIKHIILEYLDKDIEHINLMQASLMNIGEKIDKNSTKLEFFMQMFYSWLVNWFAVNPTPPDTSETFVNASIKRRDSFAQNFCDDIFNDATSLFENLYQNTVEGDTDE